jgi:uncharacterized protein (DUF427 family)
MLKPKIIKPKKGQISVWDFPRPPKLLKCEKTIKVYYKNIKIAESKNGLMVLGKFNFIF